MDLQSEFFVIRERRGNKKKEQPQQQEPVKIEKNFHLQNYRVSSEVISNKQDSSVSLIQSVTCPICLMILPVPYYECQSCSNNFCPPCLEDWWKKQPKQCIFKCQNAEFKLIKRSNTYNAVASILKAPCEYCKKDISINDTIDHLTKHCPEVPQLCGYCHKEFVRREINVHSEDCPKKPYECFYCKQSFLNENKGQHEVECPQKILECTTEHCKEQVRRADFQKHVKECPFQKIECQWCSQEFFRKDIESHISCCQMRKVQCKWCKSFFSVKEILCHECELVKELCELCMNQVLKSQMKEHKFECMFENIISIKAINKKLVAENMDLKQKVGLLEDIIEESLASRKSETLKIFKDMKESEKRNLQKDLLRIDNSIKSVEKLKNQEFQSHMKFPHLIQSWCPICRELQKKFKAMIQPLLISRKQVLTKLAEVQKFSTPKP